MQITAEIMCSSLLHEPFQSRNLIISITAALHSDVLTHRLKEKFKDTFGEKATKEFIEKTALKQ